MIGIEESTQDDGMFLELGVNRLARDLFLLTAVYALFIVMFTSSVLRIAADNSWSKEGRIEETESAQGLLLSMHLRSDGKIRVGDDVVETPEQAGSVLSALLQETPALKNAQVILNTWRDTPSARTSDIVRAISDAGLNADRCRLRFTQE